MSWYVTGVNATTLFLKIETSPALDKVDYVDDEQTCRIETTMLLELPGLGTNFNMACHPHINAAHLYHGDIFGHAAKHGQKWNIARSPEATNKGRQFNHSTNNLSII